MELLVSSFPEGRRNTLRFVDGRPGRSFCRGFEKRNRDAICFKKPSPQEAARFRATNAENLTSHFAAVERIIHENSIDEVRFANLDESGITPGNDHSRVGKKKVYCTRYARQHKQCAETSSPEFANIHRVTLVGVVFASGEAGRPTFIFEGTKLRYRTVVGSGGSTYHESIAECLPQRSDFTTRKDVAGVDKQIFIRWARRFVEDVQPLTAGGRKVLFTYDGYRSHMSIEALEVLNDAGVIAYALPAHTSGTTQPLDVGVFGAWKSHYREDIRLLTASSNSRKLDEFDFATVLRSSYRKAFTHENILAGFRGTGLHPLDEMKLIGRARPYSDEQPHRIATVEEMCNMLDKKRQQASVVLLKPLNVLKSGFIDTSKGVMLTSPQAMLLIRDKESFRQHKFEQEAERLNKSVAEIQDRLSRRLARERYVQRAMRYRNKRYGEPYIEPRPFELRRVIAKKRTAALLTVAVPPPTASPRVSYSCGSASETPFDNIPLQGDRDSAWSPTPACQIDMSVDQWALE